MIVLECCFGVIMCLWFSTLLFGGYGDAAVAEALAELFIKEVLVPWIRR
jgi:hypothetical protein